MQLVTSYILTLCIIVIVEVHASIKWANNVVSHKYTHACTCTDMYKYAAHTCVDTCTHKCMHAYTHGCI